MAAKKEAGASKKKITRDADGLIKGLEYQFTEEGLIDWRKMLDDKWLYPNPGKNLKTQDVSELKDSDLCILLGGIKELAQIRGYTNVSYDVVSPSSDYVVANCTITWRANYETEGEAVSFSSMGDSSLNNTAPMNGIYYLATTAENRAFVRCVRNFLKINIVGKEEMGSLNAPVNVSSGGQVSSGNTGRGQTDVKTCLSELMEEKGISFEKVKGFLVKKGIPNAENFSSVSDIPKLEAYATIKAIEKKSG